MSQVVTPLKTRFLTTALPDVPFDGWTPELMARTAQTLKMDDADVEAAFPGGLPDLADYFSVWATDEALKKMKKKTLKDLRVRDRVALGVRARLETLAPHKEALRAALAFLAKPPSSLRLPKLVWHAADKIWWAAGDTSTDYNHYTKRLLLSGVITSTTLYWLNDTSKGHAETWAFLERRIDDVLKIGMKLGKLKKTARA